MGFIRFNKCAGGNAEVFSDTAAGDGWAFSYDPVRKIFLFWDSCERKAMGQDHDSEHCSMDSVLLAAESSN